MKPRVAVMLSLLIALTLSVPVFAQDAAKLEQALTRLEGAIRKL